MKPVRAGDLNCQMVLQAKSVTRSASGAETPTWNDLATIWAGIETDLAKAREFFASDQINAESDVVITIRYRSKISAGMRLKIGTRLFNIKGKKNVGERNAELKLLCSEGILDARSPN